MTFEEYMESKIPGYKELVPEEALPALRKDFDDMMRSKKSGEAAIYKALYENKAGLDYTTTMQKNMDNEQRAASNLESKIEQVKQQLGIVDEEENTTVSHR